MGFSKKAQADSGKDADGRKWVIAGISIRTTLKPISTKPRGKESFDGADVEEERCTTPTGKEARLPEMFSCPPAPRKRRPSARCNYGGGREFFTPPDLESIFKCQVEKAN